MNTHSTEGGRRRKRGKATCPFHNVHESRWRRIGLLFRLDQLVFMSAFRSVYLRTTARTIGSIAVIAQHSFILVREFVGQNCADEDVPMVSRQTLMKPSRNVHVGVLQLLLNIVFIYVYFFVSISVNVRFHSVLFTYLLSLIVY